MRSLGEVKLFLWFSFSHPQLLIVTNLIINFLLMGSNNCQVEKKKATIPVEMGLKQIYQRKIQEVLGSQVNDDTEVSQEQNPINSFVSSHSNTMIVNASNRLQFHLSKKCLGQSVGQKRSKSEKRKSKLEFKLSSIKRSSKINQILQFQSTLKEFVVSKNLQSQNFGRIQINQQKFIFLRKEDIRHYYTLGQQVGQGSYGSVCKAVCLKTKQTRAVKCIKKDRMNHSKMHEVFAEFQLLKKLDHPNIIKLYEIFQWEKHYQIVTQYCNGGSIIDFIKSRKNIDQTIIRSILKQILCCLNYLHKLKIVHRDLKLQNVMFIDQLNDQSKVDEVQIKLLDFGTAFKMSRSKVKCELVGTLSYMPPQIIKGYFTDKCDIWSCGVIFHILLTTKSPFKCKQKQQTLQKILTHQLKFSDKIWSKVSQNAKDLIFKMLEKDPHKRISASEALSHPWFQDNAETIQRKDSTFLNDLSFYYRQNNLISVLQSYLTFSKISQQERKKISQYFKQIDKNNNGFIQRAQLIQAYKLHSQADFNTEQVDFILKKLDKDKTNSINFNEFAAAIVAKERLWARSALQEAFDYFDTNKTKFIERNELACILQGSDNQQIQELLKQMDQDEDHRISKLEFINYFLKKGCLH